MNAAGRRLVAPLEYVPSQAQPGQIQTINDLQEWLDAHDVLGNWRASHQFPLNTFKINLRLRARRIDPNALVAQRLKRVPSIISKLQRFPNMALARMQDIGGCRAIVASNSHVYELRDAIVNSRIKHRLVNEKDYIANPKPDGYRGIHLVYRYQSDRKQTYNNHQIELQLRSRMQHAWATAVETMGAVLDQGLKSNQGDAEMLDFFRLVSAGFAHLDGTPQGTDLPLADVSRELAVREPMLRVINRLRGFRLAMKEMEQGPPPKDAHYFLMEMDASTAQVFVTSYKASHFEAAAKAYQEAERMRSNGKKIDAVLVMADSLYSLQTAYPNYFGDTSMFLAQLQRLIGYRGP